MHASRPDVPAARLPSWRLVAAAFLHFAILAYLVVVVPLSLLLAPSGGGVTGVLALGLKLSGVFLVGFLLIGIMATVMAGLVDGRARRRLRRRPSGAADIARDRVATATGPSCVALDPESRRLLASIAARGWIYDDDRYQACARDLDIVVRTAVAALSEAAGERHAAVATETAVALGLIDQALAELDQARASAAADQARAAALYVQQRYGASDFAIKPD